MKYATQIRIRLIQSEKLKVIANNAHRSLNGQIEFIIDQYIKDYEKVNGDIILPEEE